MLQRGKCVFVCVCVGGGGEVVVMGTTMFWFGKSI